VGKRKNKKIGEGYKIFHSGKTNTRNGVGIILDKDMIGKVVKVFRKSDRVIAVKDKVWNIVSTYAPQIGSEESQKEEFWRKMDEVIQRIPGAEEVVIGDDMNVGCDRTGYDRV